MHIDPWRFGLVEDPRKGTATHHYVLPVLNVAVTRTKADGAVPWQGPKTMPRSTGVNPGGR